MHKAGRNRRLRKTHLGRSTSSAGNRLGPETRERHYGQRRMERPHEKAGHMAAPTSAGRCFRKSLPTSGPSTHGLETKRALRTLRSEKYIVGYAESQLGVESGHGRDSRTQLLYPQQRTFRTKAL